MSKQKEEIMKGYLLAILIFIAVLMSACETDNSPISPVENWHTLKLATEIHCLYGEFVAVKAIDEIRHPILTEIKWIDKTGNAREPVQWEYYYTEKDKHVYLVSFWKKDYLYHIEKVIGR
jgi:hypothetical protein